MKAKVYILYSHFLDKYYVGSTTLRIEDRLRRHLCDHSGFTAKAKDWVIVYTEEFVEKSQALSREKQIKSWKSRLKIQELLNVNAI